MDKDLAVRASRLELTREETLQQLKDNDDGYHFTGPSPDSYNTFSCEAATPQVRQNFLSLLSEEHEIQNSIFLEMSKRGWYPTPAAEQQKIDDARVKYRNMAP